MKKRDWKKVIFAALILCMLSGCGKQGNSEEKTEKGKTPENTAAADSQDVFGEDGQAREIQKDSGQKNGEGPEQNKEEEPEQNSTEEQEPDSLDELSSQISGALQQIYDGGAAAAVFVEDLSTGACTALPDQQMQSASLIKLYIAGCVYEHMEEVKVWETYEGETKELILAMISVSDNDAANTLTLRLGGGDGAEGRAAVNRYCQSNGYTNTYMGRMMLDFSSAEDNYTSSGDCGKFLERIYRNEMAGSEEILDYMKRQERTGKIPAGVPEGVVTANKTGELSDVENDAAVVYTDRGDYIICVMVSGLKDPAWGREKIIEISSMAYQYMK